MIFEESMKIKDLGIAVVLFVLTACTVNPPTTSAPTIPSVVPTPTFAAEKLGTVELDITYCVPNNLPQKLDIYYPASGGPWPVLLYVHGGGWNEGDKAEGVGWRGLNERGFLVVSINYRLAAYDSKFPVMIEDVKCAVRYLRAHASDYNLDAEHIAAIGASAGGHLVALLGTADSSAGWDHGEYADQSSHIQAVVTMATFSDFTSEVYSSIETAVYYAFGKMPGSDSPEMTAASPITYITSDDPPFLIIHGDKDGIAPLEQSQVLDEQLRNAGVESTLVIVKNGSHSLDGNDISPGSEEIAEKIVDFLVRNLQSNASP
jgi:acetyl esterase/lipase